MSADSKGERQLLKDMAAKVYLVLLPRLLSLFNLHLHGNVGCWPF